MIDKKQILDNNVVVFIPKVAKGTYDAYAIVGLMNAYFVQYKKGSISKLYVPETMDDYGENFCGVKAEVVPELSEGGELYNFFLVNNCIPRSVERASMIIAETVLGNQVIGVYPKE